MKEFFKSKESKEESVDSNQTVGLWHYSEQINQYFKDKWASWMTKQQARLSHRNQKIIWGFFICSLCGYSAYLVSNSFSETTSGKIILTPIIRPVDIFKYDDIPDKNNMVAKNELERINRMRMEIDSLSLIHSLSEKSDSLSQISSKLLDSLSVLEKFYQLKIKKSNYGNE
ncbi:hypothetical protein ACYE2N_00415 [Flavobacterium sp. MAHUQ-51]|uniref:hypothetical protein n=1 Tax=Flavobacterium sp. GCM10022190 TaxID=3252639 RepID=UPI00360F8B10